MNLGHLVSTAALAVVANAQEDALLAPTDLAPFDEFGAALAFDDGRLLCGAPGDDLVGSNQFMVAAGSVFVFTRDDTGWTQVEKLSAHDQQPGDRFGSAVAVRGPHAAIGAPERTGGTGAVYVFSELLGSTFIQTHLLIASTPDSGDRFGASLALDGPWLVVGAPGDDDVASDAGAVYVFEFSSGAWIERHKFTVVGAPANYAFGSAVTMLGSRLVVGSPGDGSSVGHAHAFEHHGNGWGAVQSFSTGTTSPGDSFGAAVSMYGDELVVGAPGDDQESGRAYVFSHDGTDWTSPIELVASDRASGHRFAEAVALGNEILGIGATFADAPAGAGNLAGATYVFAKPGGTWTETGRVTASDGDVADRFGRAVVVEGDTVVASAPGNEFLSPVNVDAGTAYVFDCRRPATAIDYGFSVGSIDGLPSLTTTVLPTLGGTGELRAVSPLSTASAGLLIVSLARDQAPVFNGFFWMPPQVILATVPFTPSPSGTAIPLTIPSDPFACTATFPYVFQAIVVDGTVPSTATPFGFTFSNGVEWWIGP